MRCSQQLFKHVLMLVEGREKMWSEKENYPHMLKDFYV